MEFIVLAIFVLGYLFIALEHTLHIDKAASALLTGTICWGLFVVGIHEVPAHLASDFSAYAAEFNGTKAQALHHFFDRLLTFFGLVPRLFEIMAKSKTKLIAMV